METKCHELAVHLISSPAGLMSLAFYFKKYFVYAGIIFRRVSCSSEPWSAPSVSHLTVYEKWNVNRVLDNRNGSFYFTTTLQRIILYELCLDLLCSLSAVTHGFTFIHLTCKWKIFPLTLRVFALHLVQGFKRMIFSSRARFSNLSAAIKSATQYTRLSAVFRVHWLKNINSLVCGRAELQYIGITGQRCAVIHSISLVLNPFHSLLFSLGEHTRSFDEVK